MSTFMSIFGWDSPPQRNVGNHEKQVGGTYMNLHELVSRQLVEKDLAYTNTKAIYASMPFCGASEVRIGDPAFKNGGLLDEKVYFCTLAVFIDLIDVYCEDFEDACVSEVVEYLVEYFKEV